MRQYIPKRIGRLINGSAVAIGGLTAHETSIGVMRNTAAAIKADREAFVLANNSCEAAKAVLREHRKALRQEIATARRIAGLASAIIKQRLSKRYSEAWNEVGFNGSLRIPTTAKRLAPLMLCISAYLERNPAFANSSLNVTPADTAASERALVDGQIAVNLQKTEVQALQRLRDATAKKVRNRLSALVEELGRLISPMDERWLAFGLNQPGQKERPPVPAQPVQLLRDSKTVSIKWPAAPRAEYYRVWKRIVGTEQELSPIGVSYDLCFLLEDVPENVGVEVALSAVNGGGESRQSEILTIKQPDPPIKV